jgi:hypothetical protein
MTSKEYMQCETAVYPSWLAEIGPVTYQVKLKSTNWQVIFFQMFLSKVLIDQYLLTTEKPVELRQTAAGRTGTGYK